MELFPLGTASGPRRPMDAMTVTPRDIHSWAVRPYADFLWVFWSPEPPTADTTSEWDKHQTIYSHLQSTKVVDEFVPQLFLC